ncbi:MAG TPA: Hpt domain-containing protein [Marinobacterium sp.]|nr:Hpt domain-containing protein [Marinobacterium sp.]
MDNKSIDHEALLRLYHVVGNDLSELEELRQDYLADAPALVSQILESAEQRDNDNLRIAAHSLKSNARDLGVTQLANAAAVIEQACHNGQSDRIDELLSQLKSLEANTSAEIASLDMSKIVSEL